MEFFLMFFMLFLFFSFVFFSKKLSMLLILEGLMISIIFVFSCLFSSSNLSSFFLLVFSIFMVLDSVFGVSVLIYSSRDSTLYNIFYSYF